MEITQSTIFNRHIAGGPMRKLVTFWFDRDIQVSCGALHKRASDIAKLLIRGETGRATEFHPRT